MMLGSLVISGVGWPRAKPIVRGLVIIGRNDYFPLPNRMVVQHKFVENHGFYWMVYSEP